MVAITSRPAPFPAVSGPSGRSSPELDAKARTCRAQLADWVTCPSVKTPEGKAKIEQISARLDSIEREIKRSAAPSPSDPDTRPGLPSARTASTDRRGDYRSAPDPLGAHVDTYA